MCLFLIILVAAFSSYFSPWGRKSDSFLKFFLFLGLFISIFTISLCFPYVSHLRKALRNKLFSFILKLSLWIFFTWKMNGTAKTINKVTLV